MPDDMALVPAGEFLMGSPADIDSLPDEQPQRRVYLSSYLIDRYEVTNEAYVTFVKTTGYRTPRMPIRPRLFGATTRQWQGLSITRSSM